MTDNVELFNNYYKDTYKKLNLVLDEYNSKLLEDKSGYLKDNLKLFANLNSGGKMIRGILVNLGYKIASNKSDDYSNMLSLAYEIFQTSILIHDDIIDNDNYRRGKETIHFKNYNNYLKYDKKMAKKVSESVAICIGDYGFYKANQLIVKSYGDDKNLSNVLKYFNDIFLKTVEGELIDVLLPIESKNNLISSETLENNIMEVYNLKTAYYTIVGPLCLGMILAGTKENYINDITSFGKKIGIAYQIQDDILGIYSDNIGKVIGSDIKEFKQTILYSYTYNSQYKDELLKYYGKENINDEDINYVRDIFKKSGAYDYAYNYMNKLYDDGIKIIDKITWINNDYKNILKGFVLYLKERNK